MRWTLLLLMVGALLLQSCASPALRRDCLERKRQVDRVAALAPELQVGISAQDVRSLVGTPDEIIYGRGMGDFDTWKYYLYKDCEAHLGLTAPVTELFFLNGKLVNHLTHAE